MSDLPVFETPPVAEVAMAIQYAEAMPLKVVELVELRQQFVDRYPVVEEHPALPPILLDQQTEITFGPFAPRLWFVSESGSDLVQVQNDRFGVNWRKISEDDEYLRFDHHVRPTIIDAHKRLASGLARLGVVEPPIACFELIYLNPVLLGDDEDFATVLQPLSDRSTRADGYLPTPEGLQMVLTYAMPGVPDGALLVDVRSAVRRSDETSTLFMQLVARGRVGGGATFAEALTEIAKAREWIVRGFADLTTDTMHKRWGRKL